MKKTRLILAVMLALTLVMAMNPITANADILNVGDQARVTATFLMYRAGPGVEYTAMAQYPANTIVTVLQVSGTGWWYRCRVPDGREDGWMFYSYLQKVGGTTTTTTPVAAAAGADYGVAYVISNNGNFVNLRAGGGTNYGTIAQLPDGKTVTMQNKGAVWSYISVDGKVGWVMTSFLQKKGAAAGGTATTTAPGVDNGVGYTVKNNGNFVNLRQGAGYDYGIIRQVADGTKVTMISKNALWSYVNVNGTKGWMLTSLLAKTGTAAATTAAGADNGVAYTVKNNGNFVNLRQGAGYDYGIIRQVADGTKVTMVSRNAVWSYVNVNGTNGWMLTSLLAKTGTATATTAAGADNGVAYTVKNNGNFVNLRQGAGYDYGVIRQVADGTKVTMVSKNAVWSYVNVNGTNGWMLTSLLAKAGTATDTTAAGADNGVAYTVSNNGNYVNLRQGAGSEYGVIRQVADGTKVTMISKNAVWSYVNVNGTKGWMMTSFLTKAGAAATTPAAGADNGVAYVVKNNGSYVNLREGAGSGYGVIRQVADGTNVTMISRNNEWSYINVNGTKGWMMTTFLQKKGTAAANNAAAGTNAGAKYVISNNGMFVNLRAGAGNGYGIIKQIKDGTTVTMVNMGPQWSQILADGSTGFVMTNFLKKK